ncbi:MAG: hypothetical protein AAGE84_18035 [Cyanobacteria bacterium P01_G01_bin.39]
MTNAAILILAIIVISSIVTTISFYFYVQRVVQKKDKNSSLGNQSKKGEGLAVKDLQFTPPKLVQSDGVLPGSSTLIGVVALEAYARKQNPQYIVGINRGGWLLSTYLAHRLDIDREHLLRFDSKRNEIIDNNIQTKKLKHKNILLVDDISRQGESIKIAHRYMQDQFPDSNFLTTVLVICGENPAQEIIDFHPYYTEYPDIQLPWSDEKRKQEARKNLSEVSSNKVISLDNPDSLKVKSPVLRIVGENKSEGMDIFNDDIDTMLDFLNKIPV